MVNEYCFFVTQSVLRHYLPSYQTLAPPDHNIYSSATKTCDHVACKIEVISYPGVVWLCFQIN